MRPWINIKTISLSHHFVSPPADPMGPGAPHDFDFLELRQPVFLLLRCGIVRSSASIKLRHLNLTRSCRCTAPRRPSERRRRQMTRHTMCPTQALHNYNCRLSNNLISFLLPSLISSSYRSAFCIPAKRLDASPCSCLSFKKTVSCTFLFSLAASGPTNFFPFNAIAKLSEYSSFFSLVCALAYFTASATTSGNN